MSNATYVIQRNAPSISHRESRPTTPSKYERACETMRRFIGAWRLVGFFRNGQPHPSYGRMPKGTIRYDSDGTMAVQIMPDIARRSQVSESPGAEAQVVPGYIAYFGSYRVDPQARTVAHDRVGNVTSGEPRTAIRHFDFLPDGRLALTLDEDPAAQVLWQRVCGKNPDFSSENGASTS
jgi:hypothetical protein